MTSKFFFSLNSIKPQKDYSGGSITNVTSDQVPGFENISFSSLKLNKSGAQEPIWHPNAHKIGYCIQGSALISMRTPKGQETFSVKEGDVFFVPKGSIHDIENIAGTETIITFALNHTKPEVMTLSNAFYSLSDDVFTATFNTPATFFEGLKKSKKQELIKILPSIKKLASLLLLANINLTSKTAPKPF